MAVANFAIRYFTEFLIQHYCSATTFARRRFVSGATFARCRCEHIWPTGDCQWICYQC